MKNMKLGKSETLMSFMFLLSKKFKKVTHTN
jgi:hypothetical protein